jgi:hypothetical protein
LQGERLRGRGAVGRSASIVAVGGSRRDTSGAIGLEQPDAQDAVEILLLGSSI